MENEIADMIAKYAIAFQQAGEEGKFWCKDIISDLTGLLNGDYIRMLTFTDGDDDM